MMHQPSDRLQNAYDAIDAAHPDDVTRAKLRGLMAGYEARWGELAYHVVSLEEVVESDLFNPATNKRSRLYRLAGKLDVVVFKENPDHLLLVDHKTTSQDISTPDAPFWPHLQIDGQVSHYNLILWQLGRKCDGAIWNVVRKPCIAPKKLTKAEATSICGTRKYFDREVSAESLAAMQLEPRETAEMYEARLAYDCSRERPEWYFQRRTIPRLDSEILEYAGETWGLAHEIADCRRLARHIRNPGACVLYGSPCKFLGICSGMDRPDSSKWVHKSCVHEELEGSIQGDGRDLLTTSRLRCFQTCHKKHFYSYVMGITRVDAEEREALVFGTLWHRALAAWWSFFQVEVDENGNGNSGNAGSQPASSSGGGSTCEEAVAF